MSSAAELASGFTLPGIIDDMTQTRKLYPVEQIPLEDIAEHPGNEAYSMDASAIEQLAASIERDGLTDLPLVRKLDDGSYQMVSGHRRRAAFMLLAERSEEFARIPCRIIEGIDDAQALVLLHSANFFTRELSVTERARATRALDGRVEQLREEHPELAGVRSEEIKARIITEQTGKTVSGRTIRRTENMATLVEDKLSLGWQKAASEGLLADEAIQLLAKIPEKRQQALHVKWVHRKLNKRDTTSFLKQEAGTRDEVDSRLKSADAAILRFMRSKPDQLRDCDRNMLGTLVRHVAQIQQSYQ